MGGAAPCARFAPTGDGHKVPPNVETKVPMACVSPSNFGWCRVTSILLVHTQCYGSMPALIAPKALHEALGAL